MSQLRGSRDEFKSFRDDHWRLVEKGQHCSSASRLEVIERQGVEDVAKRPRESRVGHFELRNLIGETIAQRALRQPRVGCRAVKRYLDLPGQTVQRFSSIPIEVVRLGELRAETCHQRPERLL